MGFSRQEYWNRLPFPSPEDLPDPETDPRSPMLQADSLSSEPPGRSTKVTLGPVCLRVWETQSQTHWASGNPKTWVTLSARTMDCHRQR